MTQLTRADRNRLNKIESAIKNLKQCYKFQCSRMEFDVRILENYVKELNAILNECPDKITIW